MYTLKLIEFAAYELFKTDLGVQMQLHWYKPETWCCCFYVDYYMLINHLFNKRQYEYSF